MFGIEIKMTSKKNVWRKFIQTKDVDLFSKSLNLKSESVQLSKSSLCIDGLVQGRHKSIANALDMSFLHY